MIFEQFLENAKFAITRIFYKNPSATILLHILSFFLYYYKF